MNYADEYRKNTNTENRALETYVVKKEFAAILSLEIFNICKNTI